MMQWLKKDRCKICTEERAVRYCLRRNKELGWKCCNSYRADGKCPEACSYFPTKDSTNSLLPKIKSDSRTEFMDFLERYLQFWIYIPFPELDNQTPNDLSQTDNGKIKLQNWLSGFSFLDAGILTLLNQKLSLSLEIPIEISENIESIACLYFDTIIAQEWDKAAGFHVTDSEFLTETTDYMAKDLMTHPILKKALQWNIINSGVTQDNQQAFVYGEINHKENWTIIFVNNAGNWRLYLSIWGTLQDYYNQKTQFREIAVAYNQKNDAALYHLLENNKHKYPLCADIQYYYGQYYSLINRTQDAEKSFRNAIILEPNWQEPIFQLAFHYMNQKDFDTSILYWNRLAKLNPQEINVQNNIGVCLLGLNKLEEAKAIWEAALLIDPDSEIVNKNLKHLLNEE